MKKQEIKRKGRVIVAYIIFALVFTTIIGITAKYGGIKMMLAVIPLGISGGIMINIKTIQERKIP